MCTRPIVVTYSERLNKRSKGAKVSGQKHSVLCTCGKCDECIKQYQNDWMTRMYSELKRQHKAVFFTLTYRDDTVPKVVDPTSGELFDSVSKDDVQSWLKNMREMRRKRGLSTDYRWYLSSEYGPTTLRPHYHGLIFGLSLREVLPWLKRWQRDYGFTTQREINLLNQKDALTTLRYTAKYCNKGKFENPLVSAGLVAPNFHLISKSIGNNYLTDAKRNYFLALDITDRRDAFGKYLDSYLEEISKRLNYSIPPFSYHLARYYREDVFAKRKDLQVAYSDYVCRCVLEKRSPELVRLSTDKPYPMDKASREAVRKECLQSIRDDHQREKDAMQSVTKFYKRSKL